MYNTPITRRNPALFAIMIDQSGSMGEKVCINSRWMRKTDKVVLVVNALISELINRCRREEGIRDYFQVVVLGYYDNGVYPLLSADFDLLTPSKLAIMNKPRQNRIEERVLANGKTVIGHFEQVLWIEPHAEGNTPMFAAMLKTHNLVGQWIKTRHNRASYPPVIINITDGEATDADPSQLREAAAALRNLETDNGKAIFMNIHINCDSDSPQAIFPCSTGEMPNDRNASLLYDMSSDMPGTYDDLIARVRGCSPSEGPFRGVSYNTPITELVAMMNIGSMSVNLME